MIRYIQSPAGRKFTKKWVRENFLPAWKENSAVFRSTLKAVSALVSENGRFDAEDFRYRAGQIDFGKLSEKAFNRLHSSVFERRKADIVDGTDRTVAYSFPYHYIDYRGLRFHLLVGQGAATWVTKTP